MKTTDLNRPVPLDETSMRWNTILSQTKKKYCQKGRAEITQEIKSAFKNSLPAQEKTKEPEKRKLEEISPQKPQEKSVSKVNTPKDFAELPEEYITKLREQLRQGLLDPKKDSGKQKAKKKPQDIFDMLDANESTE